MNSFGYGTELWIPTLTACNSSLVEVTEANSVYSEPGSVDSLAMGMFQMLREPSKSLPQEDDWLNYTRDLIRIHIIESKAKLKTIFNYLFYLFIFL